MDYSDTIPIQYQEGKVSFLGIDIAVDERVLIPRPETELLVSVVAKACREAAWKKPLVLEVGTGSGVIPLALSKLVDSSNIVVSDISPEALSVARENFKRNGYENKIQLVNSDMFSAFEGKCEGSFNCIVSNPPYVSKRDYERLDAWVKAEPRIALYAGDEGMDYLDILIEKSTTFLTPGGFLAMEVGYDQAQKVKDRLTLTGFRKVIGYRDFNDYERVIVGWAHG